MTELIQLRALVAQSLVIIDRLLAGQQSPIGDPGRWRKYPGGPLNAAGIAEMQRRFGSGPSFFVSGDGSVPSQPHNPP